MALVLGSIYKSYHWLFNEYRDTRVEHLPFLGSPIPIVVLIVTYVYTVTIWGPNIMKPRKAYDLKGVIKIYNLIQIFTNLYIGIVGGYHSYWTGTVQLTCAATDPTITSDSMQKVVFITYLYYITKIIDLLDTVFFVLRKKNNQISFLHVYHHAGMVVATYVYSKFLSGSHGTLLGVINAFVHVIMYSYYFLTSYRPELRDSLWWKKHITQIQLIQFGILVVHFLNPIFFFECGWPKTLSIIGVIQNLFMFILFLDFYIKAYVKKSKD